MRFLILLLVCLPLSAQAQQDRTYIEPRTTSNPDDLPFSGAVQVGDTLYLSGSLGLKDGAVPEDPGEEARLVLASIETKLKGAGMTMKDLAYVQIFCSDVSLYDIFNAEYKKHFTGEYPARAFIGSGPLLRGAHFEVQGIAVKRN